MYCVFSEMVQLVLLLHLFFKNLILKQKKVLMKEEKLNYTLGYRKGATCNMLHVTLFLCGTDACINPAQDKAFCRPKQTPAGTTLYLH